MFWNHATVNGRFNPTSPPSLRYLWWYEWTVFNEWCLPVFRCDITAQNIAPKGGRGGSFCQNI